MNYSEYSTLARKGKDSRHRSMAIASSDSEPSPAEVILTVVTTPPDNHADFEKRIRLSGFVLLQKQQLEPSQEEIKSWFDAPPSSDVVFTGYVLQNHDALKVWEDFSKEEGNGEYGIAQEDDLRRLFPSVVVDRYLLQPDWCNRYLNRIKSKVLEGLEQVCKDNPEDPVQHLADFLSKK